MLCKMVLPVIMPESHYGTDNIKVYLESFDIGSRIIVNTMVHIK